MATESQEFLSVLPTATEENRGKPAVPLTYVNAHLGSVLIPYSVVLRSLIYIHMYIHIDKVSQPFPLIRNQRIGINFIQNRRSRSRRLVYPL